MKNNIQQIRLAVEHKKGINCLISNDDLIISSCRHQNEDGSFSLKDNGDTVTCLICDKTFTLVDEANVNELVCSLKDILEALKIFDVVGSIPSEFFEMIPLIDKIPALYKKAKLGFDEHNNKTQLSNRSIFGYNMLDMLMDINKGPIDPTELHKYGMGMHSSIPPFPHMAEMGQFKQPLCGNIHNTAKVDPVEHATPKTDTTAESVDNIKNKVAAGTFVCTHKHPSTGFLTLKHTDLTQKTAQCCICGEIIKLI